MLHFREKMWYHKFEQMLEGAHKMEKLSECSSALYDYSREHRRTQLCLMREVGETLGLQVTLYGHFHIKHLQE